MRHPGTFIYIYIYTYISLLFLLKNISNNELVKKEKNRQQLLEILKTSDSTPESIKTSNLTNKSDLKPEELEDDVALLEFSDEIDSWVIETLQGIGCDSARSVLDINADDLVKRTDLEQETVESVLDILRAEFED